MANTLYGPARASFLQAGLDMTGTIKAQLIDLADYGLAVTGATNATPPVITTATHGLTTNDEVMIYGVGGNTACNNDSTNPVWKVTVLSGTTFSLQNPVTGANVAGNGAWTSGGVVVKVSLDDNFDDIPAPARVGTAVTLASKTYANGIFDADDLVFTSVTGDPCEAMILYRDSGVESTSQLIGIITEATGLPVTPSGGNINVTWPATYYKIFKL